MKIDNMMSILLSFLGLVLTTECLSIPIAEKFDVRSPTAAKCPFVPSGPLPDLPSELPVNLTNVFKIMDNFIDNSTNEENIPSIVAGIAYRGEIIHSHGAGVINKTAINKTTPTIDTQYRIGSVSKIFPVLQSYMGQDSGLFSLDDSLASVGNNKLSFVNPYGKQQQPSLRELCSQRAGLPREAPCDRPLLCNSTNSEMTKRINQKTVLIQEPGGIPSYSNMAFSLLGHELTPANTTWEDWVQTSILDPLEMKGTGFGLALDVENANVAVGYHPNGAAVGTYSLGWNMPCGGMRSTIRDLSTIAGAIMSESNPLIHSRSLAQELVAPVSVDNGGNTLFGM